MKRVDDFRRKLLTMQVQKLAEGEEALQSEPKDVLMVSDTDRRPLTQSVDYGNRAEERIEDAFCHRNEDAPLRIFLLSKAILTMLAEETKERRGGNLYTETCS